MSDEKEPRPEEGPESPSDRDARDRGEGPAPGAVSGDDGRDGRGSGAEGEDADGRPRRHRADETLRTGALPDAVECPHCGETESEQFSAFGSAVSVSQYYCRSCRTVFEFFKWR